MNKEGLWLNNDVLVYQVDKGSVVLDGFMSTCLKLVRETRASTEKMLP